MRTMRSIGQTNMDEAWGRELRAAAERDGTGFFTGTAMCHCDNSECATQQMDFWIKFPVEKLEAFASKPPCCPLCRESLTLLLDGVETDKEANEHGEMEARISVNIQRYKMREAARLGVTPDLIGIPPEIGLDDSLPA